MCHVFEEHISKRILSAKLVEYFDTTLRKQMLQNFFAIK